MSSPALQLSVVIPTFNRAAKLRRALRSLAAQATVPGTFEIIVVDDGSRDETAAVVEQARPEVSERALLRYVPVEHNGPAAARNAGVQQAESPAILFTDDDCEADPSLVATHLQSTSTGIATIGQVIWHPSLTVTPFMELVTRGAQFNFRAIADPDDAPFSCFYTANASVMRADVESAGLFDGELPPYYEDTELAYRLRQGGVRFHYRPQAVVSHDHPLELASYLQRQRRAGRAAVQVLARHPELREALGVDAIADVQLREQFYSTLLRYAFVLGVEDALLDDSGATASLDEPITGSDLRSQFEEWVADWATKAAADARSASQRGAQLEAIVEERDRRFAKMVQEKDSRMAVLEAELRRYQRLWPLTIYRQFRQWLPF
ncbi:MAG: hypothetical protein CL878_07295 [Dehalococcoidia bacterium]|nr:hypothetical protein [Dehalococcoidia bacterium]